MPRPGGIVSFKPSPQLFPFESRWFDSSVGPVHCIDEGSGRTALLLHGNPDRSFLYRKIVLGLRDQFRCVVPNYPGFGLSVHPDASYRYTAEEHANVMRELVEHLDLQDAVVMRQDWGGPSGMDVASRLPDRITGLVMGNTWYWPADSMLMKAFSLMMGSPPLHWLIVRRNFFVTTLMKRMLQAKLPSEEFDHYCSVVPTPRSRAGIAEFPRQIRAARPWLAELERRVGSTLTDKPMVLFRGAKDPAFGSPAILQRWPEVFPQATAIDRDAAGHYIQEDAPEPIIDAIIDAYGPEAG